MSELRWWLAGAITAFVAGMARFGLWWYWMCAMTDKALLFRSSRGDITAMQELARRENPVYKDAFREACIEVLGEDPYEDDWSDWDDHFDEWPRRDLTAMAQELDEGS